MKTEKEHTQSQPSLTTALNGPRRVAIAVDLSDESGHAVTWAVDNYLREGDSVVLLHVRPTSVLYGADWGCIKLQISRNQTVPRKNPDVAPIDMTQPDEEYDEFAEAKAKWLGSRLEEAGIPFMVHIVKDHDLKQRLCLEVERLGLSCVVMGSKGFGYSRRRGGNLGKRQLGSVSDYCVRNSICPVIVVRNPEEADDDLPGNEESLLINAEIDNKKELYPVREEDEDM